MSIKSRLASEVVFALNSLTLLSLAMRQSKEEQHGILFNLAQCGDLLDELVDLLEETAFGLDADDDEEDDEEEGGAPERKDDATKDEEEEERSGPERSYRELFRLVTQEEAELNESAPTDALKQTAALADKSLTPLGPIETVLALTNLFRNFSVSDDNAALFSKNLRVVEVLVKVADLPLRRRQLRKETTKEQQWPLRVSAGDSMALKKDVLETIINIGSTILLELHQEATSRRLLDLLLFFLADADHHDQLYFDLSNSPSASSRIPQPSHIRVSHYLELGLAAFALLTLPDSNRYIVARLAPSRIDLYKLFESLIHQLPITESDFQIVTSEPGLVFVENLAMSLYNLAFLSPIELKLRLRVQPSFVKSILRLVRRLSGGAQEAETNAFLRLSNRCIAILQVLSDLSGVSGTTRETSDAPWWGLAMSGDETDRPKAAQPTEEDRGTVKQVVPPSGSSKVLAKAGPPILTSEKRALFELLWGQSLAVVFGNLADMFDGAVVGPGGKK